MSINASERLREYDDYGLNQKNARNLQEKKENIPEPSIIPAHFLRLLIFTAFPFTWEYKEDTEKNIKLHD